MGDKLPEASLGEGYDFWLGRRALGDWRPGPPVFIAQQPTILEPCRLLCPGMRGDCYQLSGALGTPSLSDATVPALCCNTTYTEGIGTLPSSYHEMWQWQPISGRCRTRLRWRQFLEPVPLRLDPS